MPIGVVLTFLSLFQCTVAYEQMYISYKLWSINSYLPCTLSFLAKTALTAAFFLLLLLGRGSWNTAKNAQFSRSHFFSPSGDHIVSQNGVYRFIRSLPPLHLPRPRAAKPVLLWIRLLSYFSWSSMTEHSSWFPWPFQCYTADLFHRQLVCFKSHSSAQVAKARENTGAIPFNAHQVFQHAMT